MSQSQNLITPPPELVQQWRAAASNVPSTLSTDPGGRRDYIDFIATRAAQWGADQELEALLVWLRVKGFDNLASDLLSARRPKPPSLKEQALLVLDDANLDAAHHNILLRALEQLDD